MTIIEILILAIIQGLTEFIPVSSSGHLAVLPHLFKWKDQGLDMDIALHLGTLLAVIVYFRHLILDLITNFASFMIGPNKTEFNKNYYVRLSFAIIIATLPSILVGFLIKDLGINTRHIALIGWASIIFGVFLFIADHFKGSHKSLETLSLKDAVIIGFFQIFAFIPGASRSGVCLTGMRILGIKRTDAAKFTFLLSIPVILGATILSLLKFDFSAPGFGMKEFGLGITVAFLTGLATIHFMLQFLNKYSFGIFTIYRVLLGIFLLSFVS